MHSRTQGLHNLLRRQNILCRSLFRRRLCHRSAYSVEEDIEEHFTVHWPRHVFGVELNAVIVVSVTFHPSVYVLPEERLVLMHNALICMIVLIRKQSAPTSR